MKYKTANEVWENELTNPERGFKTSVLFAMKTHAINFGKWLNDQGWQEYDESDRWIQPHESRSVYTTEQLYDQFNKSSEPETNLHPVFKEIVDTFLNKKPL